MSKAGGWRDDSAAVKLFLHFLACLALSRQGLPHADDWLDDRAAGPAIIALLGLSCLEPPGDVKRRRLAG